MRSWIPVPGTTTGRLAYAALELFGAHGFAAVGVGTIATQAGVTTGSLYHHFGSKEGLYRLVRADVEQRVVDRLEGAVSATAAPSGVVELAPVLLVGFDYLVSSRFLRLLGEASPESTDGIPRPDPIELLVGRVLVGRPTQMPALIGAVWRTALWQASAGAEAAHEAREACSQLLTSGSR